MVEVSNKHKSITVGVSSNNGNTVVTASSDSSQYWANQSHTFASYSRDLAKEAKDWANKLEGTVDGKEYSAKHYAELANSYIEGFENVVTENINNIITTKDTAIDSINSTKTTILNDIEFVADGEKEEIKDLANVIKDSAEDIIDRVGLNMFDTVVKDHILTYEESKGLALQGTWVYKDAIAGERFGYPDFYSKAIDEYQNSSNEQVYVKPNITAVGNIVDNKGVLTGFSGNTNYVNIPVTTPSNSFELVIKTQTPSTLSSNSILQASAQYKGIILRAISATSTKVWLSSNGTSWDVCSGVETSLAVPTNATVWFKISWDGALYSFAISTDGNTWTQGATVSNTNPIYWTNALQGLGGCSWESYPWTNGSIDLTESYLDIDGERWWDGAEYLHCKKNSNGHIFYDIAEKGKADEVFNQFGTAWFYGIDQENERVFLPRNKYFATTGAVVGNGMTLGLTNGSSEYGLAVNNNSSYQYLFGTNTSYGSEVGTTKTGNANTINLTMGITTDATKSGIVLNPDENKHLYICVGNQVSDTSWIDVVTQVQQGTKDIENTKNVCLEEIELRGAELRSKMGLSMFDTILKDHILTYEESKGLALQGTYVYKNAVAGSRYGYADFYNKVVDEYNKAEKEYLPWVQPIATGETTAIDGGDMVITTSSANGSYPAYKAMDGVKAGGIRYHGWGVNNTSAVQWWQVKFPYQIRITGLTGYSRFETTPANANTIGRFYTSSDKTTPIGDEYNNAVGVNWNAVSVTGIPAEGIITDTIYFEKTGGGAYGGLGELKIEATTLTPLYKNPNGHLFYDISEKEVIDKFLDTMGSAWFYGVDTENERVFLPRNNWFEQATGDSSKVGESVEAGLPDHYHKWTQPIGRHDGGGQIDASDDTADGVHSHPVGSASETNPIYGKSDTVQPASVKKLLYICVGNTESTSSVTDVVEVTTTENDTTPLFTGMYFDFTPNNVSWLKAGQQKNNEGIYKTCYNELVNELTTPKYNLKVIETKDMIVGIDYSEYWKVNQDDMTFTTPSLAGLVHQLQDKGRILVDKKEPTEDDTTWYNLYSDGWLEQGGIINSGVILNTVNLLKPYKDITYTVSAVAGNPTITNSGSNVSICVRTTTSFSCEYWTYNWGAPTGYECMWQACGYAEIPTVSEYTENVNLYFKVANAVQNLELLDAGEVLEAINNAVPNNRELITSYCCPDYENMITVSIATKPEGTYTAPCNGFVIFDITLWSDIGYITIDGKDIMRRISASDYMTDYSFVLPVAKSQVVSFNSIYTDASGFTSHSVKFVPMKGAN